MNPTELAHAARALVDTTDTSPRALWARSAALLARQSLEMRLAEVLRTHAPGAQAANFRAQLVCLKGLFPGRLLPQQVAYTWAALSRATHHFAYELAPTAEELKAWLETVEAFAQESF